MFKKTRRNYHSKREKPIIRSRSSKSLIRRKIDNDEDHDLPEWYLEGLPKLKRTVKIPKSKHKYQPIRRDTFKTQSIKDVLYPAWVGRIPYPEKMDLIQGKYMWGLKYGVGNRTEQILWQKHLKVMKKYLPTVPKIPPTRELWRPDQLEILWKFYRENNPKKLTDKSIWGFDGLVNKLGPHVAEREIKENYELTLPEILMGKKIIDLKLKPHLFTLQRGTYLFHGSPDHDFEFNKLVKPDMITNHLGFSSFLFFGLSAAISLWYTVERFSKKAAIMSRKNQDPGEFEAYLYVYRLKEDLEFQYIEDDIIYNQESSLYRESCNKMPCLHPQFAYHSIEQLDYAQGPVELDWELTIPIKQLDENKIVLVGKYYINVLKLLSNSQKNINQFDPISAIDFTNLIDED